MQHFEGGCLRCGKQRDTSPPAFGRRTQLYLIRDDGNKTVVGLCESCYKLDNYDYDQLGKSLAESEMAWALDSGNADSIEHAKGFAVLKFVGHKKR